MNFLFILNTFYPNIGGVENATFEICKRLKERSHNVFVLTTDKSNYLPNNKQLVGYERKEKIDIYRVRFAFRLFALPLKALYLVKRYRIDYCYVTDFWGGIALILNKIYRIKFVYVLNGYNSICPSGLLYHDQLCQGFEVVKCLKKCHKFSVRFFLTFFITRLLIWGAQTVIAVSKTIQRAHLAIYRDIPIKSIYYGIDIRKFQPKTTKQFSQDYGLKKEDKIILFFGRFIKERGVSEFLERFVQFFKGNNFKFIIVGLGPELFNIKSKIETLNLKKQVKFLGSLRDEKLIKALNISDVVILPILFPEPLSLVLLEAMACGKAVVSFNLGGVSEVIEDKKTGFLIPPHDWTQFINKLHQILMDDDLRKSMGMAAHQTIEEKFNWNQFIDGLMEELQ